MAKTYLKIAAVFIFVFTAAGSFAAVDEYLRAVQLDGSDISARFNLGLAYYREKKYDDAVAPLKKALEMNKNDVSAHKRVDFQAAQLLGIIYFEKNSNDDAINYFEKAASINASDGNNYYYLGLAYKKDGKQDKALGAFLKAIRNGADNAADNNFRIGQIYYDRKDYRGAVKYFEKAAAKDPGMTEAREYLGDIYDKIGNADKATENYLKVIKSNPDNMHAQYQLGLNYFKLKEYDRMIASYKKAIAIDPNFADAHYNLGMAYYYRNMYDEAIAEFQTAIKLKPDDAASYSILAQTKTIAYEYHKNKGTTYLTAEDYLQAKQELQKSLDINPGDAEAQKFLDRVNEEIKKQVPVKLESAKNNFNSKNYGEAYKNLDFVLTADPGNSEARDGMAKIENNLNELVDARVAKAKGLEADGRLSEAAAEYSNIIKIAPKSKQKVFSEKISLIIAKMKAKVSGLIAEANKAYAGKNYAKALRCYNEALKCDPANSSALNGVTKINSKREEEKEIYLSLARQSKVTNSKKEVEYYKKAVEMDPNNEEANRAIEDITGRKSSVSVDAQKIKALYYDGVDKYVNGEVGSAIKIWKKVLEMDPNHVEAKRNIERAEEKMRAIKKLSR
jgi:tetratricopeptide (TPR) repeat protein